MRFKQHTVYEIPARKQPKPHMKKALILFTLIAVVFSCGDSGLESIPQNGKTLTDKNGRQQITPCPNFYPWFHTATGTTYVGIFERHESYKVMPYNPVPGFGMRDNTFTFTIKNTGNMPMAYKHNAGDPWTPLPINATHTFTKYVPVIACNAGTAQTYNYIIYGKATNCPAYAFGGQFRFRFEVTLTGVTNSHRLATATEVPPGELYSGHKWISHTTYWDCGALPGCYNANCIPN